MLRLTVEMRRMHKESVQLRFVLTDRTTLEHIGRWHMSATRWRVFRRVLEQGCRLAEIEFVAIDAGAPLNVP